MPVLIKYKTSCVSQKRFSLGTSLPIEKALLNRRSVMIMVTSQDAFRFCKICNLRKKGTRSRPDDVRVRVRVPEFFTHFVFVLSSLIREFWTSKNAGSGHLVSGGGGKDRSSDKKYFPFLIQGISQRPFPGWENVAGKLRHKKQATAGAKFTKPGNGL